MDWQDVAAIAVGSFTAGMIFAWALDVVEAARNGRKPPWQ